MLNTTNIILLIILVVIVFIIFMRTREPYVNSIMEIDESKSEIQNPVKFFNPDTRTLMAAEDYIPNPYVIPPWGSTPGSINELSDGQGGNYDLNYNLISPAFCTKQWPVPFKLDTNPLACAEKDQCVPSQYMGNNAWSNAGCMCITKKQMNFLRSRGGNTN